MPAAVSRFTSPVVTTKTRPRLLGRVVHSDNKNKSNGGTFGSMRIGLAPADDCKSTTMVRARGTARFAPGVRAFVSRTDVGNLRSHNYWC